MWSESGEVYFGYGSLQVMGWRLEERGGEEKFRSEWFDLDALISLGEVGEVGLRW